MNWLTAVKFRTLGENPTAGCVSKILRSYENGSLGRKESVESYRATQGLIHERALAPVSKKLKTIFNEPNRRVVIGKVRSLQEKEKLLKTSASQDHYTTGELAKDVSYDRRHIARIAATLPGAYFDEGKWKFKKSRALHLWISQTRKVNSQRARRVSSGLPPSGHGPAPKKMSLMSEIRRFNETIRDLIEERPIKTWNKEECRAFMEDLSPINVVLKQVHDRLYKALLHGI